MMVERGALTRKGPLEWPFEEKMKNRVRTKGPFHYNPRAHLYPMSQKLSKCWHMPAIPTLTFSMYENALPTPFHKAIPAIIENLISSIKSFYTNSTQFYWSQHEFIEALCTHHESYPWLHVPKSFSVYMCLSYCHSRLAIIFFFLLLSPQNVREDHEHKIPPQRTNSPSFPTSL